MRAPRSLFVAYDGLMEPLGAAQVIPYILGLRSLGHRVSVLSFEKPEDLARSHRVQRTQMRLKAGGVDWIRQRYHRRPSLPATAWDVRAGARAIRDFGPDLVHARSYVPGAMALHARRRCSFKLLFDMRGFWVDERVESGAWQNGDLRVRIARGLEQNLLASSDHVVHLTESAAVSVADLAQGLTLPPHTVIPTSVSLERFAPADDPTAPQRQVGLPNHGPILVHSGTMGHRYHAALTMAVAREFIRQGGGTFLVLSKEVNEISRLAEAEEVPVVLRTVDHHDMPTYLQASHAGIAFMRTGFATRASAPTKVGEYLACGLAVASTAVGDLEAQFEGSHACFTVSSDGDPAEIAQRLHQAIRGDERVADARGIAERYYSQDEAVRKYSAIYSSLGVSPCA